MELNGKKVVNLEIDGVQYWDYPDFCDAHFSYAEYEDGTALTDEELDEITDKNGADLHEMAYDSLH